MSLLTDERVPEGTEPKLAEYLNRMFRDARLSDLQSDQFLIRTQIPDKISVGKLYYFMPIAGTVIDQEGWYHYSSHGDWHYNVNTGPNGNWDDLRFPFTADRIDSNSTRYSYDYTEQGVSFHNNARYPNEAVGSIVQLPHSWREGTITGPHLHWIQNQVAEPNFLMRYRKTANGAVPGAWTNVAVDAGVFPYVNGMMQISPFPDLDLSDMLISGVLDIVIYRDTTNASGLFAGADPVGTATLVKEFDIHIQFDSLGSEAEFTK